MKVLLATDGSKHAEESAWLLAHLPHNEPLELTVLSVGYVHELHGSLEVVDWLKANVEAEKVTAKKSCQRIAAMFEGANATVESVIVEGHAGKTIVDEAEARGAELIVLGSIGHSTVDRLLLGSVSDFVATHAHCSVLMVRSTGIREKEHGALSLCLGYDDSAPSALAISQLGRFGWGNNTKVDLVNVVALPFTYSDIPIEVDTQAIKTAMMGVLKETATKLDGISPEVTPHVIESNHVGDGLVQFAKDNQNDLLVLGDTGRGMLGRFLLGSVSRYVMRHAECSVWIAREQSA